MEIHVVDRQRLHRVSAPGVAAFLQRVARAVPAVGADELAVSLVSDRAMRALNRAWRGRDRVTDVLSFPAGDEPAGAGRRSLGDIVIATGRAAEQAREAGRSLAREIRILALHGYLHLVGYDHETDDGTMMRLQRRLERRLLVPRARRAR